MRKRHKGREERWGNEEERDTIFAEQPVFFRMMQRKQYRIEILSTGLGLATNPKAGCVYVCVCVYTPLCVCVRCVCL